jgi:hypothetical protein
MQWRRPLSRAYREDNHISKMPQLSAVHSDNHFNLAGMHGVRTHERTPASKHPSANLAEHLSGLEHARFVWNRWTSESACRYVRTHQCRCLLDVHRCVPP